MFTFIAAFIICTIRVILTALDEWIFAVRIGDKIRLNEPAPSVQNVMCSHGILFPKVFFMEQVVWYSWGVALEVSQARKKSLLQK